MPPVRRVSKAKVTSDPMLSPERVEDPQANKTIVAAIGTLMMTVLQYAVSGELNFEDEGLTALAGALTTILVWFVSNWPKPHSEGL